MSRSSTIVLAYAIKHLGVSLRLSFQQLQQSRQCARPNPNYFQQLIEYERECLGKNSVHMVDIDSKVPITDNHTSSSTTTLRLPDIYVDTYPELLKYEQNTYQYLKTKLQQQQQSSTLQNEYTGELRPYIIEQVSYEKFFHELDLARQQHTVYVKERKG